MSLHRFFLESVLPPADGGPVPLPLSPDDLHHAVSVLRLHPGEEVEAVEPGVSAVWRLRVEHAGRDAVTATPLERMVVSARPRVLLVQGIAKGEKMESIVRQAVEVGADEIIPVLTDRSVVRLDAEKRQQRGERWRRIARAAAEQAHRDAVPEVHDPATWTEVLPQLEACDRVVVLWEEAGVGSVRSAIAGTACESGSCVALVVGPEGGLAPDEVDALARSGAVTATLGSGILRTETAAIVGLALVLHELGGLGNAR